MQKRKAVIHQKQKSQDVSSRRSAAKPAKPRDEQARNESPVPLAFHVDIPKGLKDILVKSRAHIKQKEKVASPLSPVCRPPLLILSFFTQVLVLPLDYSPAHAASIPERPLNVKETLEQFTEYFLNKANEKSLKQSVDDSSIIPVITRGLLVYFEKCGTFPFFASPSELTVLARDRTLATNTLYFEERGQYAFLDNKYRSGTAAVVELVEEQPICSWYGADHLLRLLSGCIHSTLSLITSQSSCSSHSPRNPRQIQSRCLFCGPGRNLRPTPPQAGFPLSPVDSPLTTISVGWTTIRLVSS